MLIKVQSHTILGSKEQRGLTQMSLDVLFKSIGENIRRPDHPDLPTDLNLLSSLQANDSSEAQIYAASTFLDSVYGDDHRGRFSRAQTPMTAGVSRAQTPMVRNPSYELPGSFPVFSYPVVDRPSSLCPPAPTLRETRTHPCSPTARV